MYKKEENYKPNIRNQSQSIRQLRIGRAIHSALVEFFVLGKSHNSKFIGVPLTFTKITLSRDIKIAYCYFVPFGEKYSKDEILEALQDSYASIRKFVTERVNLKFSPVLKYIYDYSTDNVKYIEEILNKI